MCARSRGQRVDMSCRLEEHKDYIQRRIVEDGVTHRELSDELRAAYPSVIGLGERSIRRFCRMKNIHRTPRISKEAVEHAVTIGISQVAYM